MAGANINTIITSSADSWLGLRLHSSRCDDTYLAGALGAAIHSPFIFILVHDAVVEAHSTLDVHFIFKLQANFRLGGKEKGRMRRGLLGMENLYFAKVPIQMIHQPTP